MDRVREWFGETEVDSRLERVRRFWNGGERFLVSVHGQKDDYRHVFDPSRMLELAPSHLRRQAALPGLNLPAFIADFGTVSTGAYWGGNVRFDSTGGNVFIDPPADKVEHALFLAPRAPEAPDLDAAKAIRLHRLLCDRLETDLLWLRTPDMQGVLNTAAFIVDESELLISLYGWPDLTHRFLHRVEDFLVGYAKFLRDASGGRVCGNIWPYVFLPQDLGLSVTEDLMPLLSPELYEEYGVPGLKRMSDEFGGLVIHCCGEWGRHAPVLRRSGARIRAVEVHHPLTRMEEMECLADDTVFIPYLEIEKQNTFKSTEAYYQALLDRTPSRFRYWFAFPADTEEAVRFAKDHGF
jgi:hypothetical protein